MQSISVGGIIAEASGLSAKVSLYGVISTTDIILNQDKVMYVGGIVGYAEGGLFVSHGLSLGDIYLKRVLGTYNSSNVLTSYFINGEYYIGGLIGRYGEGTIEQDVDSNGFAVLGTIRDYAIGQKAEYENTGAGLHIGPVVGQHKQSDIANNLKIYYNENISLVSDNGFFDYFTNVEQRSDSQENYDDDKSLYKIIKQIYNSLSLQIKKGASIYSKFFESYCNDVVYEVVVKDINFKQGTKFNPIVFDGTNNLEKSKYYIVIDDIDISSSINSAETGWVLNVQGFAIKGAFPIFNTITENSAVVGLLLNFEEDTTVIGYSLLAGKNYGFMFACGVGGKGKIISNGTIASFVNENYGVISTSFSTLNIEAYTTAGLVLRNGVAGENYTANIYNCYYTGTLSPKGNDANNISGISNDTKYGVISNCYTMGDIDSTVNPNVKAYAIAPNTVSGSKQYTHKQTVDGVDYYFDNLYKCFYDYVAYTGSAEGIDLQEAKEKDYITSTGIYVWSSSLSGDKKDTQHYDAELISLFSGSWLAPGDSDQLVRLYKKSFNYMNGEVIEINTTWINYGYTTNNITNIITNIFVDHNSPDNAMKYLTMLYTGNGKTDKEHVGLGRTNGFEDGPYKIKHAGLLDILVKANNDPNMGITYRYYLLTKSIDFIKYTGETYWSKSWDDNNIAFVGDLDGDNNVVFNMYSKYGLLRALPDTEISNETRVRDINFKQSYSKTGLVAGYMGVGIIENINVGFMAGTDKHTNIVYNGDFGIENRLENNNTEFFGSLTGDEDESVRFNNLKTDNFAKIVINEVKFKIKNSIIIKNCEGANFAGGIIGIMEGGLIEKSCSFNNLNVLVSDREASTSTNDENMNTATSYAGGLAGVMFGGEIQGGSSTKWNINGITVASVNKSNEINTDNQNYVGGVVGYLGKVNEDPALIRNVYSKVTVRGSYSLGGIAGYVNGGEIENSSASSAIHTLNTDISVSSGFNIKINSTKINVDEIYVGVIAGKFDLGEISDCDIDSTIHIYNNNSSIEFRSGKSSILAVGGIVGLLVDDSQNSDKSVIASSTLTVSASITLNNNSPALSIIGGLIGRMCGGKVVAGEVVNSSGSLGTNTNDITGGVVGRMEYGKISGASSSNKLKNKSSVDALDIAGGIVGKIEASGNGNKPCEIIYVENQGKVQSNNITGGVVGYIKANLTTSNAASDKTLVSIKSSGSSSSTIGTANTKLSGGIVGFAYGSKNSKCIVISQCVNSSAVETLESGIDTMTAGIVAVSYYTQIQNCKNTGVVTKAYASAGIVAFSKLTVVDSAENSGNIAGTIISGGISAVIKSAVIIQGEVVNSGSVSATSNGVAGGIISIIENVDIKETSKIRNTGTIGSATTAIAGGIIGYSGKINSNSLFTCVEIKNEGKITTKTTSDVNITCSDVTKFDIVNEKIEAGDSFNTVDLARVSGGIIGFAAVKLILINAQTNSATNIIESKNYAGGIVGYSNTTLTISNVTNNQKVDGDVAGGIVSMCEEKTLLCTASNGNADLSAVQATILGSITNKAEIVGVSFAGGIIGVLDGSSEIAGNEDTSVPDAKLVINEGNVICNGDIVVGGLTESGAGGIVGLIKTGIIKGIAINNATVTASKSYAGGLIGYFNGGKLYDYAVKTNNPTISGLYVGGIIGMYVTGTIESKKVDGTKVLHIWENIKFATSETVGGLIGYMSSAEQFEGIVNFEVNNGQKFVGGLVGILNDGKVSGGEVKQFVKGLSSDQTNGTTVGGLVGSLTNKGEVNGGIGGKAESGMNVGGLVGSMTTADNKISGGTAQSANGSVNVGGLVGLMELGTISGTEDKTVGITAVISSMHAGGMVGRMNGGEIKGGSVKSSSSESKINGQTTSGGLVGLLSAGSILGGVVKTDVNVGGITAGGLVGSMEGGEISAARTEKIEITGTSTNGGLVGSMVGGTINSGTVGEGTDISGSTSAGGLVGTLDENGIINGGTIESGEIKATAQAGGLVGLMSAGTINKGSVGSYNNNGVTSITLKISATQADSSVGGLVGVMVSGDLAGGTAIAGTSEEMTLDGVKYTKTLSVNLSSPTNVGGAVGKMTSGTIKKDGGSQPDVSKLVVCSGRNRGGLVGVMEGADCTITGGKVAAVSGAFFESGIDTNAGGVAGIMYGGTIKDGVSGTFEDSGSTGFEVGPQADIDNNGSHDIVHGIAGGIVGYMENGLIKFETQKLVSIVRSDGAAGGAVGFMKGGSVDIRTIQKGKFLNSDNPELEAYGTRVYSTGKNACAGAPSGDSYASAGGAVGYAIGSAELTINIGDCAAAVMTGRDINISTRSGGIVGNIKGGTLIAGKCSATLEGGRYVGGVAGYVDGASVTIDECTATVKGNLDSGNLFKASAGGVAGKVQGEGSVVVKNKCEAIVSDGIYTGGVVGYLSGGFIDIQNTVSSTVNGSSEGGSSEANKSCAGGVVGQINGMSMSNNVTVKINSSKVVGGYYTGGVVGYVTEDNEDCIRVEKCTNIYVISDGTAGGIVGYSNIVLELSTLNQLTTVNYVENQGTPETEDDVKYNYAIYGWEAGGIIGKGGVELSTVTMKACINSTGGGCGGISGNLDSKNIILNGNLNLSNVELMGSGDFGMLAPVNNGSIEGNSNTISISGNGFGLVSSNEADKTIKDIRVTGSALPSSSITYFGVIAGQNSGSILNCDVDVDVSNSSNQYAGGIAGVNYELIEDCSNSGNFSNTSVRNLGGIAGSNIGEIYSCDNSGSLTSTNANAYIGGIAGYNRGTISSYTEPEGGGDPGFEKICSNIGSIRCSAGSMVNIFGYNLYGGSANTTPTAYVGGIVGYAEGGIVAGRNSSSSISNSANYNKSSATITDYRGQIAGGKSDSAIVVNADGHSKAERSGSAGVPAIPETSSTEKDGEPIKIVVGYLQEVIIDQWDNTFYRAVIENNKDLYNKIKGKNSDNVKSIYDTINGYSKSSVESSKAKEILDKLGFDNNNEIYSYTHNGLKDEMLQTISYRNNSDYEVDFDGIVGSKYAPFAGYFAICGLFTVQKYKTTVTPGVPAVPDSRAVETSELQDCGGKVESASDEYSAIVKLYNLCDCPDKPMGGTVSEGGLGMVEAAEDELANGDVNGGKRYWEYVMGYKDAWCACFVSYCANRASVLKSQGGPITKTAGCIAMWNGWPSDLKHTRIEVMNGEYVPLPGDVIFYCDHKDDSTCTGGSCGKMGHVGIVIEWDSSAQKVKTIEGNLSDSVKRDSHNIDDKIYGYRKIHGFGTY